MTITWILYARMILLPYGGPVKRLLDGLLQRSCAARNGLCNILLVHQETFFHLRHLMLDTRDHL